MSAAAHARLMFRNEVEQLDAVAAILCMESSMTTSSIVDTIGDALHSNFTGDPDKECIQTCDFVAYLFKNIEDLSHFISENFKLNSLRCFAMSMKIPVFLRHVRISYLSP